MAAWRSRADAKEGIALRAPFNQHHTPNTQGPEGAGGQGKKAENKSRSDGDEKEI